jgi:hypothetical protein
MVNLDIRNMLRLLFIIIAFMFSFAALPLVQAQSPASSAQSKGNESLA